MDGRLNSQLVEKFGELEKLCNEIYGDKHGVTLYINEMHQNAQDYSQKIPEYNQTLKRLRDIRHKRNKLSHGEVAFDTPYADESDIMFATEFKRKILKNEDPLSVIYKKSSPIKNRSAVYSKYKGCTIVFVLSVSILLLGLLMVFNLIQTIN